MKRNFMTDGSLVRKGEKAMEKQEYGRLQVVRQEVKDAQVEENETKVEQLPGYEIGNKRVLGYEMEDEQVKSQKFENAQELGNESYGTQVDYNENATAQELDDEYAALQAQVERDLEQAQADYRKGIKLAIATTLTGIVIALGAVAAYFALTPETENGSYWYKAYDQKVELATSVRVEKYKYFDFRGYLRDAGATGLVLKQSNYVDWRVAGNVEKADATEMQFLLGRYTCGIVTAMTDQGTMTYWTLETDGVKYYSPLYGGYDLVRDPYGPMAMLRGALVNFMQLVEGADFALATTPFEQVKMNYSALIEGEVVKFHFDEKEKAVEE